jgi:hypothetical protein
MQIHEDFRSRHQYTGPSDRGFGLVAGAACGVAGFWPLMRHQPVRLWFLAAAALFLLLALALASVLHPLNVAWAKLGLLLNGIVTPVIMGVLFFAVITPVAYFFRLRGRDALRLKPNRAAKTYWLERQPPGPLPQSMANQF